MAETLFDIVKRKRAEGMSAIQVHKWLRENNMGVPWIVTKKEFMRAVRETT